MKTHTNSGSWLSPTGVTSLAQAVGTSFAPPSADDACLSEARADHERARRWNGTAVATGVAVGAGLAFLVLVARR